MTLIDLSQGRQGSGQIMLDQGGGVMYIVVYNQDTTIKEIKRELGRRGVRVSSVYRSHSVLPLKDDSRMWNYHGAINKGHITLRRDYTTSAWQDHLISFRLGNGGCARLLAELQQIPDNAWSDESVGAKLDEERCRHQSLVLSKVAILDAKTGIPQTSVMLDGEEMIPFQFLPDNTGIILCGKFIAHFSVALRAHVDEMTACHDRLAHCTALLRDLPVALQRSLRAGEEAGDLALGDPDNIR